MNGGDVGFLATNETQANGTALRFSSQNYKDKHAQASSQKDISCKSQDLKDLGDLGATCNGSDPGLVAIKCCDSVKTSQSGSLLTDSTAFTVELGTRTHPAVPLPQTMSSNAVMHNEKSLLNGHGLSKSPSNTTYATNCGETRNAADSRLALTSLKKATSSEDNLNGYVLRVENSSPYAERPEIIQRQTQNGICKNLGIRFLNFIISVYVIGTLVVLFWRGTWTLLGLYVLRSSPKLNAAACFGVSFTFVFILMLLQPAMLNCVRGVHFVLRRVVLGVVLYLLAIAGVGSWRGVWLTLDIFTGTTLISGLITHAAGFIILVFTRTTASLIASPGMTLNDRILSSENFDIPVRRFESTHRCTPALCMRALKHVTRCFITVFIVGTSVVMYWRGTWTLMDNLHSLTHPSTLFQGACVSAGIGAAVCSVCHWAGEPLGARVHRTTWFYWTKALGEHAFMYVLGFGVVNYWRAVWYLADVYILPDNVPLSGWLCHGVAAGLLYLGCASINLVSPPAGCRTHSKTCLEGFSMGSYLQLDVQPHHPPGEGEFALSRATHAASLEPDIDLRFYSLDNQGMMTETGRSDDTKNDPESSVNMQPPDNPPAESDLALPGGTQGAILELDMNWGLDNKGIVIESGRGDNNGTMHLDELCDSNNGLQSYVTPQPGNDSNNWDLMHSGDNHGRSLDAEEIALERQAIAVEFLANQNSNVTYSDGLVGIPTGNDEKSMRKSQVDERRPSRINWE